MVVVRRLASWRVVPQAPTANPCRASPLQISKCLLVFTVQPTIGGVLKTLNTLSLDSVMKLLLVRPALSPKTLELM